MTRVLIVVAALVLGLIGLLMSVCGGGVVLMTISSPGGQIGSILMIAVPSVLFGILFVWVSVVILRKNLANRDHDS
jgi:hypothetical protein